MQPLTIESPVAPPAPEPASDQASPKSSPSFLGLDLDRGALIAFGLLIVYTAGRSLCKAFTRPLWYDELCTWIMLQQHPFSLFWKALRDGVDGQPPLFYLLERPLGAAIADQEIALRLLSILAFSCTVACIFLLIRRRIGSANALVCAAIPLVTVFYDFYAVEARPYALMMACLSLALLCYDRAPEAKWMFLMAFSLTLAEALHYYSVLAIAPFMLAEMALTLKTRRLRWTVWLAFTPALIPLAAFWPLLAAQKAYYGAHFWAQPSFLQAAGSYGWLFRTKSVWLVSAIGVATLALFVAVIAAHRNSHGEPEDDAMSRWRVLALSFLALPFLCFLAAKVARGGMTERYMMPSMFGFALAAAYILHRWGRSNPRLLRGLALGVAALLLCQEAQFWYSYTPRFSPAKPVEALVAAAQRPDLPVFVSDAVDFLELAHYSSPGAPGRFVSLLDAPQAVAYSGADTVDRELAVMRNYAPLPVYDFAPFVAQHPVFLLYSGFRLSKLNWWPIRLMHDGYTLQPLAYLDRDHVIFLVSPGNKSAAQAPNAAAPAAGR